ncbi:MAG: formyltransferase family protein [Desulfatirhabdiaceae bacterium]
MKYLLLHELAAEEYLLARIIQGNPGREIRVPIGPRWGKLILPAADEGRGRQPVGLRVLVIGSWTLGFLSLETIKDMERKHPNELSLVGLVTDDPLDKEARISVGKRFWRYYDEGQREEFELGLLEAALTFGVPCYTGEVKNDYFRAILARLDPEVIIVSAFGQAIDRAIIQYPPFGIYNVHPSDLRHGFGAGPQPWEDLLARNASTTRVTIHHVAEAIDGGSIVGQSPLINVLTVHGTVAENVRMLGEKTLIPVAYMVGDLVSELIRRREQAIPGPIESLDFEALLSRELKEQLKEPIDPARKGHLLPLPPKDLRYSV